MDQQDYYQPGSNGGGNGMEPLSGGLRVLLYILSFFIPLVGIIVGIIYLNNPLEDNRKFGKGLMIFSIIILVLWCICALLGFFGLGILGNWLENNPDSFMPQ